MWASIFAQNNRKKRTFNWANLIGHSKSKQPFFIRVQGKDPIHIQLLGGGDGRVSGGVPAGLVSDVLVDAVGPCLVDGTQGERIVSGTCGGHRCKRQDSAQLVNF